jgi:uncharacterized membrane protein
VAQHRNSRITSNKRGALICLGLIILLASLTQAAWQQTNFSCSTTHLALGALSSVTLAAWQTIHAHPCAQDFLVGLLNRSGTFWPLLLNLACAL